LTPICTKSFVATDPTWGAYSAPPESLGVFRGPAPKGRGLGEERGGEDERRSGQGGVRSLP